MRIVGLRPLCMENVPFSPKVRMENVQFLPKVCMENAVFLPKVCMENASQQNVNIADHNIHP